MSSKIKNEPGLFKRTARRLFKNQYATNEEVLLWPLSFFVNMEVVPLPLPVFSSTKAYLGYPAWRRIMSLLARIVQIAAYLLLGYLAAFYVVYPETNLFLAALLALFTLFATTQILLSLSYSLWMLRHFTRKK